MIVVVLCRSSGGGGGRGGHFEILSYWKDANMSMLQSIGGGSDLVLSAWCLEKLIF